MIQPIGNKILVKQDKKEEPKSGILTPETIETDSLRRPTGEIIAINEDTSKEYNLKVGDKVYFQSYDGLRLTEDKKEYLVLTPNEILAKKK